MRFSLDNLHGRHDAAVYFDKLLDGRKEIEIKEIKKSRSAAQNRALHLYFTFISDALNEMGQEFCYTGVKGMDMSIKYSPDIVKDFFWRPIQTTLFEKESTKDISSDEINEIIQIVNKFFGDKGVSIEFPSYESLMIKMNSK
jgi:hypothetical protein